MIPSGLFLKMLRNTFEEVYQKYSFDRYFDSFNHYYTPFINKEIPNSGLSTVKEK